MAVRIRLRRIGKNPKKNPHFRFSVFDETRGRDSKYIEEIGYYSPVTGKIVVKKDRFDYWVGKGAQPSESINKLINKIKKEK